MPSALFRSFRCVSLGVLAALVSIATASGQTPSPVNCSDPLLSTSSACQQQPVADLGAQYGQQQQGDLSEPNRSPRQGDNSQVYVDSAGNRWQRATPTAERRQTNFPPDPVTEFQKLARSSTGEPLTIFGRDLFQRAPSTFAPADEIPVTPDYVLGPGDEVLVRLWGGGAATGNSQLTVDLSGDVYLPRVGTIHVAGLRASELQDRIRTEVNRVFRNYQISVSLGQLRSIQIYVVGEARRPGAYTISGLSTVLNALFASGGPNVQGSMRRIQVRRGDKVLTEFDLYDLVLHGDKSRDVRLESGDTIFIPPVGPQVALAGSVRHPAIYELKSSAAGKAEGILNDLLALAGGLSATASDGQVRLERIDPDSQRRAVNIALDTAGRAMPLRDGDVLYAGHISLGFQKTVTIRGNLANPGRFAWKPGMHLSDIIPDRSSLLTGDYWRERNRLGVPTPLFRPYEFNSLDNGQNYLEGQTGSPLRATGMPASSRDPLSSVQSAGQQGADQQVALAAGGVVSNSTTAADQAARAEAARTLFGGNSNASGDMPAAAGNNAGVPDATSTAYGNGPQRPQTPPVNVNRVNIPAPEISWSYAVIERLDPNTLKSSLLPFNLGRLVQDHDPAQNLELQPGDVVTILNQRDILVPQADQTKYVRLEGEFAAAGVYSAAPGETLDQLVLRAGGFTPSAYLYGSSFQRESARAFQQQRLDEYITRLSTEMERNTAVRGASTSSGISDPNALALERNLIGQLRELRATGRVVLEFVPESAGVDTVPHIALENGDVFRVPARPSTISVIGAVYGQNVFLYNPARRLQDYLALAGKTNRVADKDHAFIIRADGSVFSRELAKGVFSNNFDRLSINPGDAIVIPERPIKPNALRQLLDYSQVLSSFGLAAAAINVVR